MIALKQIIHKELKCTKLSAIWVPNLFSLEQKQWWVQLLREFIYRFKQEGNSFQNNLLICSKTGLHDFIPESKRTTIEWRLRTSTKPKKAKILFSARKLVVYRMCGIFYFFTLPNLLHSPDLASIICLDDLNKH